MIFLIFLIPFCAFAKEHGANLDHLIAVTQKTLENEITLKETLAHYESLLAAYNEDTQDKDLLFEVAKQAKQLRELIERSHFTYLFSKDFLEELHHFSGLSPQKPHAFDTT